MVKNKKLGVIGGMGPFATVQFLEILFAEAKKNGAVVDQQFPQVAVEFACHIPDRSSFLLGHSQDTPETEMVLALQRLEASGASVIGMTCNTAHAFWEHLHTKARKTTIVLNMIEETVRYMQEQGQSSCLILATDATMHTRLYTEYLQKAGIAFVHPQRDSLDQKQVMDLIFGIDGVKAGHKNEALKEKLRTIIEHYPDQKTVILACSELPLLIPHGTYHSKQIIDPIAILAKKMMAMC